MSKKKKDKIEEQPKKTKAAVKEKPAKAKKGIVPASMPVLVPAAAPTTTEATVPPAAPASKAKKATPAKKAPAKKAAKPAKEPAAAAPVVEIVTVEEIVISTDDIALRAYFISEARRARGHGGDEHGDWVEAERQLRAEASGKKK